MKEEEFLSPKKTKMGLSFLISINEKSEA